MIKNYKMGQFLAVGISTKLIVSKEKAEKGDLSLDEVLQKMKQSIHFHPSIYDFSDEDGYWRWNLKKQIWEEELLGFLNEFYPLLNINKSYTDFEDVLKKLAEIPTSDWLELAENKSFSSFQFDEYGENEWLYFEEKPFRPKISIGFDSVLLELEGKIIIESWGKLFNLFAFSIQKAFPTFQLSKAIRVYITG